jgi:hypothetical protein
VRTVLSAAVASVALSLHGASLPTRIQVPPGFRVNVFARGHRGALLVADWGRGVVYRIQAHST